MRKYIKEQSGFMHDHLSRILLDMIDYIHFIEDDSFVLFIDFYEAFDTAIHDCLVLEICFWKPLKHCIVAVKVLPNLLMIPHKDSILILALGKDASLSFLFL